MASGGLEREHGDTLLRVSGDAIRHACIMLTHNLRGFGPDLPKPPILFGGKVDCHRNWPEDARPDVKDDQCELEFSSL